MQKFQSSNGLESNGKLDALSLQKLGLGSDIAGVSAPKPIVPHGSASLNAQPVPGPSASIASPASEPSSATSSSSNLHGNSSVAVSTAQLPSKTLPSPFQVPRMPLSCHGSVRHKRRLYAFANGVNRELGGTELVTFGTQIFKTFPHSGLSKRFHVRHEIPIQRLWPAGKYLQILKPEQF